MVDDGYVWGMVDGGWLIVDGEPAHCCVLEPERRPFAFTEWRPGEPAVEGLGAAVSVTYSSARWGMRALNSSALRPYICEKREY